MGRRPPGAGVVTVGKVGGGTGAVVVLVGRTEDVVVFEAGVVF